MGNFIEAKDGNSKNRFIAGDKFEGEVVGMRGLCLVQFEAARRTWEDYMQVRVIRDNTGTHRMGVEVTEFEEHL